MHVCRVDLVSGRRNPPLVIPSDALAVRGDGTVHTRKIEIGRDYGDRFEVTSGLHEGDLVIPNAGDLAREGLKVEAVPAGAK